MEKVEKWDRWIIDEDIPDELYTRGFVSDENCLTIAFSDKSKRKRVTFIFEGALYSFRFTDEGCFLKTLDYLYGSYPAEHFQTTPFFKVRDSKYLQWFKEECCDIHTSIQNFEHYAFYNQDGVIEVLSPYAPTIKIEEV